jgi:Asp-tRNA(Asn)/Glu-tRNA(Gln) amidotransferase A subunit family amidase
MLPLDTWRQLDATALLGLLRRRELGAKDLLDSALAAVTALDPHMGAVVTLHAEEAHRQIADRLPTGPLAGLPFLLKDLGVSQRGTVTTDGLPACLDVPAARDCPTVARCRTAGLVLFGKTHSAPLGLSVDSVSRHFGATRNPWDPSRSAGGSSGGAAAAVAAGIVPVAQASDGGGSLRIPAALCGVVGFMPTAARAPLGRGRGGAVRHVLARTVRDMALFTHPGTWGVRRRAWTRRTPLPTEGPLRIAVSTAAPFGLPVHPSLTTALDDAARRASAAGHSVARADPPLGDEVLLATFGAVQGAAAAEAFAARTRTARKDVDPGELEPLLAARLAQTPAPVAGARRATFRRDFARFFERFDLLLQPVTAQPTPAVGALSLEGTDLTAHLLQTLAFAPFCWMANAAGLPSMSLPLPGDGLPRGLLVTGRWGAEATLLDFAAWWESEAPWVGRRPPLPFGEVGSGGPR